MKRLIKIIFVLLLFSSSSLLGMSIRPSPDSIRHAFRSYDFPEKDFEYRFKVFRSENLHLLKKERLATFTSLEYVFILMEAAPLASDRKKEKVISLFEKNSPYLKELLKCPQLKGVIFKISSYIFIREKETSISYNVRDRKVIQKAYKLNLRRFDKRFGEKLKKLLPGIKLYSQNAGW